MYNGTIARSKELGVLLEYDSKSLVLGPLLLFNLRDSETIIDLPRECRPCKNDTLNSVPSCYIISHFGLLGPSLELTIS
jgi:hypothetical protein